MLRDSPTEASKHPNFVLLDARGPEGLWDLGKTGRWVLSNLCPLGETVSKPSIFSVLHHGQSPSSGISFSPVKYSFRGVVCPDLNHQQKCQLQEQENDLHLQHVCEKDDLCAVVTGTDPRTLLVPCCVTAGAAAEGTSLAGFPPPEAKQHVPRQSDGPRSSQEEGERARNSCQPQPHWCFLWGPSKRLGVMRVPDELPAPRGASRLVPGAG